MTSNIATVIGFSSLICMWIIDKVFIHSRLFEVNIAPNNSTVILTIEHE
ncbi:hypothetical protein JCM17380_47450 [Desulfosporosinus burensis]